MSPAAKPAGHKHKRKPKKAPRVKRRRGVLDLPKAIEERMAEGRAERESVPLDGRPDPVGVLEAEDATRVPELVPIRHGRMIVSPFTFYRGGAAIMAGDLSRTPATGLRVQCCGDAHLSNFGVFAAPDRRLVFDLNDFDETLRRGRPRQRSRCQEAAGGRAAYRTAISAAATMRFLDVWYERVDAEQLLAELDAGADKATRKAAQKNLAKARSRTSLGSLSKFAQKVDGEYRIKQQPPVIVRPPEATYGDFEQLVRQGITDYAHTLSPERRLVLDHYHMVDFARKSSGSARSGPRRSWSC